MQKEQKEYLGSAWSVSPQKEIWKASKGRKNARKLCAVGQAHHNVHTMKIAA